MQKKCNIASIAEDSVYGLFLQHLKSLGFAAESILAYRDSLRYFLDYLQGRGIESHLGVTRQIALDYIQSLRDRKISEASIDIYCRPAKQTYDFLIERQELFINPFHGIIVTMPKKLQPVLSQDDVSRILDAVDLKKPIGVRDRALLELLYNTGLRRAEIIRLNLVSVNLADRTVRVLGKGSKERLMPIGNNTVKWMERYINDARIKLLEGSISEALWIKSGGGRIGYELIEQMFRKYKKILGYTQRLSCHDFRRAFATHMLQNGADPVSLQHLLGHADLSHLKNYLRLTIADLKKAHAESRVSQ